METIVFCNIFQIIIFLIAFRFAKGEFELIQLLVFKRLADASTKLFLIRNLLESRLS